jgi:hypothetical protein
LDFDKSLFGAIVVHKGSHEPTPSGFGLSWEHLSSGSPEARLVEGETGLLDPLLLVARLGHAPRNQTNAWVACPLSTPKRRVEAREGSISSSARRLAPRASRLLSFSVFIEAIA